MKKTVIIQTRMGSTRLSGKVLMNIEGKPVIWHVVNRLRTCRNLDDIVIATTNESKDDILEEYCIANNFKFYRGSEHDVLSRYYEAATDTNSDIVVRVTSDCPLIDPDTVDLAIELFLENDFDYVSNTVKRTYPRGLCVEVFSYETLKICYRNARHSYQREHVTPYVYENIDLFKIGQLTNDKDLSNIRITLDTKDDYKLINKIYSVLYKNNEIFKLIDIVEVLNDNPDWIKINEHVKQKELKD